jgi:hypothetical protein
LLFVGRNVRYVGGDRPEGGNGAADSLRDNLGPVDKDIAVAGPGEPISALKVPVAFSISRNIALPSRPRLERADFGAPRLAFAHPTQAVAYRPVSCRSRPSAGNSENTHISGRRILPKPISGHIVPEL